MPLNGSYPVFEAKKAQNCLNISGRTVMWFLRMLLLQMNSCILSDSMTMIGKSSVRQIVGILSTDIKHEIAMLLSPHRDLIIYCAI